MKLRIGTRQSRLALAQTDIICSILKKKYNAECEVVRIITKGDVTLDRPLTQFGGKGVFVSEIETLLAEGKIDIAVHSGKDLPVKLAEGLIIGGVAKRADARDVMITKRDFIPQKSFTVGTGSIRRRLQFMKQYPECRFMDIRGNIDTRIIKMLNGEYDALILASAGLDRLKPEMLDRCTLKHLSAGESVPAPAQGIIAAECRKDSEAEEILNGISDKNTMICFLTERRILEIMESGCNAPLGAYAEIKGTEISVTAWNDRNGRIIMSSDISDNMELAEKISKELKK